MNLKSSRSDVDAPAARLHVYGLPKAKRYPNKRQGTKNALRSRDDFAKKHAAGKCPSGRRT